MCQSHKNGVKKYYFRVLPGLIGGKSLDRPSPELYVRWAQAVSLMPAMQFGYLPWEIIGTTVNIA